MELLLWEPGDISWSIAWNKDTVNLCTVSLQNPGGTEEAAAMDAGGTHKEHLQQWPPWVPHGDCCEEMNL